VNEEGRQPAPSEAWDVVERLLRIISMIATTVAMVMIVYKGVGPV
jgi:hypothetical protein